MAKKFVMVLGIIFIVVGILGYFNNPVLGLFPVNGMHNLVHLVTGVLAVIFAMQGEGAARGFAKTFGIIYLLVAILGFVHALGFLMSNGMGDNILHLVIAVLFLWAGFGGGSVHEPSGSAPM